MLKGVVARGKSVRRFAKNIFLNPKFDKILQHKPHGPGKSPINRKRKQASDFAKALHEKQMLRFTYGLSEKQLRSLYQKSTSIRGDAGMNMLIFAEQRLDVVFFRAGFAASLLQARQIVGHNHVTVNQKMVNIPSFRCKIGDVIHVRDRDKSKAIVKTVLDSGAGNISVPAWIQLSKDDLQTSIIRVPERQEFLFQGKEQLIIEYYSR